jgi:hypothetical protein
VFVDKDFTFLDTLHPWEYPDSIIFNKISSGVSKADFIAVKRGDINRDWKPQNFRDSNDDNRNQKNIDFKVSQSTNKNEIYIDTDNTIYGFQISFRLSEPDVVSVNSELEGLNIEYALIGDILNISVTAPYGVKLSENVAVININSEEAITITANDNHIKPQLYFENETFEINLVENVKMSKVNNISFISNVNYIEYQGHIHNNVNMKLIDMQGQTVKTLHKSSLNANDRISTKDLNSGVYIINMQSDSGNYSQKILIY